MPQTEVILSPEIIAAATEKMMLDKLLELYSKDYRNPVYLFQDEAFTRYGKIRVKRWLEKGKIRQNTSRRRVDYRFEDLEKCAIEEDYIFSAQQKRPYRKGISYGNYSKNKLKITECNIKVSF